ncbi:MAG: hypothetical protein K9G58_13160 [Bacteroidales bacterium]|nr:hypothetical protein [Bacteroidales bacterium]MCF8399118.1 hypothetical protein [Bacteroidales bacterium]
MKKSVFVLLTSILLTCFSQTSFAQFYGKWILPIETGYLHETFLIEFEDGNVSLSPENLLITDDGTNCRLGAAGYNTNYDLQFYFLDDKFCYDNHYELWAAHGDNLFSPEYQLINRPGYDDKYFIFYTQWGVDKANHNHFGYNEIGINQQTSLPENIDYYDFLGELPENSYAGFAISEEIEDTKLIFTTSQSFLLFGNTGQNYPAGLRQWTLTDENQITNRIDLQLANAEISADDFSAYNLEMKFDESEDPIIAWITNNTGSTDKIFLYMDYQTEVYDLDLGRIGELNSPRSMTIFYTCHAIRVLLNLI